VGGDVLEQQVVSAFRVEIMRPKGGDKGKEPDVGQWERCVINAHEYFMTGRNGIVRK
jgi:hypothetical protein